MTKTSDESKKSSIYHQIFIASKLGDINELQKIILSIPENEAESIIQNLPYTEWLNISKSYEPPKKSKALIVVICLASIFFILSLGFFAITKKENIIQLIAGTYTPTPTQVATVTQTLEPTLAPTETLTVIIPTPIPTEVPASAYLIQDLASIYPELPAQSEETWLLESTVASFEPSIDDTNTWMKETSSDPSSQSREYVYSNKQAAIVTWPIDQPLPSDGIYGIYVLDTIKHSEGKFNYVVVDDVGNSLSPFRGINDVTFLSEGEQSNDIWQMIGYYQISAGTKIKISTKVDTGGDTQSIAVDRIIIIRLNKQGNQMISHLTEGRKLLALFAQKEFLPEDEWTPFQILNSWLNIAWIRKPGWGNDVLVNWKPGVKLPPGKYEILVWIPGINDITQRFEGPGWKPLNYCTAKVSYALTLNGEPLSIPILAEMEQDLYLNEWVSMGIWEVTQDGLASVRLIGSTNQPDNFREICADAVAILSVGE